MMGMLVWKSPQSGKWEPAVTVREHSVLHVRFLCAEILRGSKTPEALMRRRVAAVAKKMRRRGVVHMVLPDEFPYSSQLEKLGLSPVSTVSLRQLLAADWIRWVLESKGIPAASARIAVIASRLTGEVVRTITELTLRHRYVLLKVPHGGEELSRRLRREYGVSLLIHPTQEQLDDAELRLAFDPEADGEKAELRLYDQGQLLPSLSIPPVLEEKLPEGVCRNQMLAVLWEAGVIRPGQIAIGSKYSTKSTFL